jgi:hypothetical protein
MQEHRPEITECIFCGQAVAQIIDVPPMWVGLCAGHDEEYRHSDIDAAWMRETLRRLGKWHVTIGGRAV